MKTQPRITILGGGLSGLTLAYVLALKSIPSTILEASSRLGGRIHTIHGNLETPLELGVTWLGDKHRRLTALFKALGVLTFPQYDKGISLFQTKSFEPASEFVVPESEQPSYRIAGGSSRLIDSLVNALNLSSIHLNTKVTAIEDLGEQVVIRTDEATSFTSDIVVSCLPVQLLSNTITFIPELPEALQTVLAGVQTWMAGSIKFTVEYEAPFWREKGFSGMLYSHAGIIREMYDHTNAEGTRFGFTGFLNSGTAAYSKAVRQEYVLSQLGELFGLEAADPTFYEDKVWNDDYVLAGSPVIHYPHQNNGHLLLQKPYFNEKFWLCGTETALHFAGYMEGAVVAAESAYQKIMKRLS